MCRALDQGIGRSSLTKPFLRSTPNDMSILKDVRDIVSDVLAPKIAELRADLEVVNSNLDGVVRNFAVMQAEMKQLRSEHQQALERLAKLEGKFDGAAERIRLEIMNSFYKAKAESRPRRRAPGKRALPPAVDENPPA